VTDAGRGHAVAIVRSLGRRGYRVVAADSAADAPGLASRYAAARAVYPRPDRDPAATVAAIEQIARQHGVDLIIPVTDAIIMPLSEARTRFDGWCQLALPSADALAVARDKARTVELARQVGVPVPATVVVESVAQALAAAKDMTWPVVLKPRWSWEYRQREGLASYDVAFANTPDALRDRMQTLEGRCAVLLQEYCPGQGVGVELLLDDGRPLAAFAHRRLHELPMSGGASTLRESVALDPDLYRLAVRMMGALRWTGWAMVEFKVGSNGPRLMEINGRAWGSLPLATRSGMDFPARLASLYLEGPPSESEPVACRYAVGVRCRNLELDLAWIVAAVRGRGGGRSPFLPAPSRLDGMAAALGLLDPRAGCDVQSLDDPLPGLLDLRRIARRVLPGRYLGGAA